MADRLSALDTGFIYLESPRTPMHVGSLSVFEGGPLRDDHGRIRIDEVQAVLEERMPWVPRFAKRLAGPPLRLGRPVWVDDADFDIRHHVRLASLPPPGTPRQLRELAATLHMELLDRSRPLWELWLIDGLADGRVAMVEKLHHALVDGVSSVDVATFTLDPTPEIRHPGSWTWVPERAPSALELAQSELVHFAGDLAGAAGRRLWSLGRPRQTAADVRRLWRAAVSSNGLVGPRTSLNQAVGTSRLLDSVAIPLAAGKDVAHAEGLKLNDVILATVAGGLRRLFLDRGDDVEGLRPNVLVPVSLRSDGDRNGEGNLVSGMVVPLPVDVGDPVERLHEVAASTKRLREADQPALTTALMQGADAFGPLLPTLFSTFIHHQPLVNLVVTNVPGPPVPLYLLGARMQESVPIVPLAGNLDVSVGVLSYDGEVVFGLFADAATCPDVHVLAEGIEKSFAELSAAELSAVKGVQS